MAGVYNIVISKGETYLKELKWLDKNKNIIPLDGFTALMKIESSYDNGYIISELSTENNKIKIENDVLTIIISDLETESMTFDKAVYSLKLKGNGIVKKLLVGTVTISNGG